MFHRAHSVIRKPEEKILHPSNGVGTYFHNNIEIQHQHNRKKIVFTAWNEGIRVNTREHEMPVQDILNYGGMMQFYQSLTKEWDWLCEPEQKRVSQSV